LRTHTTAVSSRYLKKLAEEIQKTGEFKPKKYFSIDRVFRNEEMDATHLCEFHQVEGMVIGKNLSLGDLIGFMKTFFSKIGIKNLKFKPAFNPYTGNFTLFFNKRTKFGNFWIPSRNEKMDGVG
jgi:phenylalanyl-tRNA synthetase alpha chain